MLRGNLRRALALVRKRTPRGEPVRVTLYERPGCHLCDETRRALGRIALERALEVERVDVEAEGLDRYALRIPVLRAGADELDAAGLPDAAIARWLDTARTRSGPPSVH